MSKFDESNFYKALQDFFINNNKDTFLEMLSEFYNRTEGIIIKNEIQDDLIKELRELYLEFNEKGIDENIVREKVNYFLENTEKMKTVNINNLVTLTTGTQYKNCTKLNKNISLTFRTNNTNIETGTIIGNIDTSIRPKTNIVVPCVGLNGAGNRVQGYGQAILKSNGDIEVTLTSSCSFLAISFSYNI